MLRIAKSLITIAAVAAIAVGATGAYFTDSVTINGNTLSTGTIDINVDGNITDVNGSFTLADMKPGYVKDTDFVVNNTGSNPANIYKTVAVTADTAELASVLDYHLSVAIPLAGGWNQTLYDYNKTVAQIQGSPMFLGMLPAGASMNVTERYRMQTTAGDEYQNQSMTFNITVTGEQLEGTLVLENKNPSNWQILGDDTMTGTLTYGVMDAEFNFTFTGAGLANGTGYTLVMGADYPFAGGTIASGTSNGTGGIALAGSMNFGVNKINQKVWLVLTSDMTAGSVTGWTPASYLFETGLIDYYDSSI